MLTVNERFLSYKQKQKNAVSLSKNKILCLPSICDKGEDAIIEEHDSENQQPVS